MWELGGLRKVLYGTDEMSRETAGCGGGGDVSMWRHMFALTSAVASALILGTVGPASAATTPFLNAGVEAEDLAPACASLAFPPIDYIPQTAMQAFQVLPAKDRPAPGNQPFYIGVIMAGIGQNCAGGGGVLPEFILPPGVSVVNQPGYKPFWESGSLHGELVKQSTPLRLSLGPDPGGVLATLPGNQPFHYTNGSWDLIFIPVRTTRALSSNGPPRQCTPSVGDCPDDLTVYSILADGGEPTTLDPWVGLFATKPPARRGTLALYAPASVTPRQARRGVAVRVAHAGRRKKALFKLLLNDRVIARARAATSRQGDATVVLKTARRLRAGSRLEVAVTVGRASALQAIRVS